MLDMQMLKAMPPDTTFAVGIVKDERLYKEPVAWVAIRGRIEDWAIYYHKELYGFDYISKYGDKCFIKGLIQELVPCDDEAFKAYRF